MVEVSENFVNFIRSYSPDTDVNAKYVGIRYQILASQDISKIFYNLIISKWFNVQAMRALHHGNGDQVFI